MARLVEQMPDFELFPEWAKYTLEDFIKKWTHHHIRAKTFHIYKRDPGGYYVEGPLVLVNGAKELAEACEELGRRDRFLNKGVSGNSYISISEEDAENLSFAHMGLYRYIQSRKEALKDARKR